VVSSDGRLSVKILVVEDTLEYQKIISHCLGDHQVFCRPSVDEALTALKNESFDLIIVDINLPGKDGYTLLGEIQGKPELLETPILCITGRNEITDKITAFSLGADDYLTKPFDPLELKARAEAKLKRYRRKKTEQKSTTVGNIEIDHDRHRVAVRSENGSQEVEVTQTEFKILCCLARRPDQVYTRDQLLVAAWGEDARVLERVVDSHICLLRKKLGSEGHCIKAVTGLGYKMTLRPKRRQAAS